MSVSGKKILIAVSGGIAAYKIHFLIRDFVKKGAEVQVIMTPDAENFVTKLSLSTLSKKSVYSDFYSDNGTWNSHVEMALWSGCYDRYSMYGQYTVKNGSRNV